MMIKEDWLLILAEYMNLVDACRNKGIDFEPVDGMSLAEHKSLIDGALTELGLDNPEQIEKVWTGEIQLTSS